jgi:hypothetical protein
MMSLSGIIGPIVLILTKGSAKKPIRPDNDLIRVLVRKSNFGVEE